jgi:hypothetical protein
VSTETEARAIISTLRALDDDPNTRACNPGCPRGEHEHERSWWGKTGDVIEALLAEREEYIAHEDLADFPEGTILRDEIGRVFIRNDSRIYHWRTIWGPGFDLSDDQAMTYAPVRVLYLPPAGVSGDNQTGDQP